MHSILIGYVIGDNRSGIDTYLKNVSKILKDADYEVDFLTNDKTESMIEFCAKRGIGLIEIPSLKDPLGQYKKMKNIFLNKKYDVAYFNISEAFHCIAAMAATSSKIKKVIIHSHSSSVGGNSTLKKIVRKMLHLMFKNFVIPHVGTDYLACSKLAAEWMFKNSIIKRNQYKIVNNAVEVQRFMYNPVIRMQKRQQLELGDKFLIGHVSGFTPTKNVSFLIDVLNEARQINSNIHLLLIGEGEETEKVKLRVRKLELEKYVTFLGARSDVNDWLQAMDAFVLPSIFEGAPIVAIEAQVAGLMVYLSETVTREVKLSEKCQYISLEESPEVWAKTILFNSKYVRDVTDFSQAEYCFDTNQQKEELLSIFGSNE